MTHSVSLTKREARTYRVNRTTERNIFVVGHELGIK